MATTFASNNPEYARLNRRTNKALTALDHAHQHLCYTCPDDAVDYAGERATFAAVVLLEDAINRIQHEYEVERKRLGVDIYRPYGGRGGRKGVR